MVKRSVLVSLPLLVAAALLGLAARTPGWTQADLHLSEAVQSVRAPWLTAVAGALNVAFGTVGGTVLVIAITVALVVTGYRRTAVLTLVVILAGWWIGTVFKAAIARPRPPAAHELIPQLGQDSFPSGHVCLTLSIVIALVLLARGTAAFWALVAMGAVLVAAQMLARVYLGVHYPTDTIGSLLVTSAAVILLFAFGPFATAGKRNAYPHPSGR